MARIQIEMPDHYFSAFGDFSCSSQLEQLTQQRTARLEVALHQVQEHERWQALLYRVSQILNSSLEPALVLERIVALVGECFQVDRGVVLAITEGKYQTVYEWRSDAQVPSTINLCLDAEIWPEFAQATPAARHQLVLHAPNFQGQLLHPDLRNIAQASQTVSVLQVPIFMRDRFYGCLALHTTRQQRSFKPSEIQLLEQFADQMAIALFQVHSSEHLERLVQERTQALEQEKRLSDLANQAKSEFLSKMSHELRTPLTAILGFSDVLLKQIFGKLNEKQAQYLGAISASGRYLLELINDLLDLSKIEAGKEELVMEYLPIAELCRSCLLLVQEHADRQGLQLQLDIDPEVHECRADRRRLKQILFNLLTNAIKFTDRGSVTLRVRQDQDLIYLAVIDTGVGIPPEEYEKLFTPFQRLENSHLREGTGLGLALTRQLVQAHGGDLTVQSEEGRGSCFTVQLPR